MIYFPIPHSQAILKNLKKSKTTQHFTVQARPKSTHMIYLIWGREEQLFLCLTCALAFRPCTVERNLHPTPQDLIQQGKKKRKKRWFLNQKNLLSPLREQSCPQPRTNVPLSSYPVTNSQPRLATPGVQRIKQKETAPTLQIFSSQLHKDSLPNTTHTL